MRFPQLCAGIFAARAIALSISLIGFTSGSLHATELNVLVWCDNADPNLLRPFEEANGVKINVKEYEGTGAGLAIVEQSQPGDWDVMVIDSIDVPRAVEKGLFEPLPEEKLPIDDIFREVRMNDVTVVGGKRYGVTEKFGYNTISYNKEKVNVADMQSLAALTDPKYKGRLAIAIARHLRSQQKQRSRDQVHPVRSLSRGAGTSCDGRLLLGHAGQQQGCAEG
jgi:spermidine/putrescine transport system substrate-binding protein